MNRPAQLLTIGTGKVVLGLATVMLLALPARANLITNGSFETPLVPVGGFTNFNSGSTGITGWTVTGPQASIVSKNYTSFGLSFPAEDGSQWLDLTGDGSNAVEGVEQAVATTAGATYDLSYFVGNQVNPGGPYGTTSTVKVYANGVLIQTAVNSSGAGGTKQVWEQFSTSFVAASGSTTIEFLNGDPPTDNTNGLDNIVLVQGSTSPVPEPSTFVMFGLALFAAGFLALRRHMTA
ncbi:MAG: DUF642 domain-containing protein [Acidobacteriota bacterium]|nr:DUF642 domain-containing protein [Acidobacteriota bacterium]